MAFDAKEVTRGQRWNLSDLTEGQFIFLKTADKFSAISFVLVGFWEWSRFFVIPFPYLHERWEKWTKLYQYGGRVPDGVASISIEELSIHGKEVFIKTSFLDYLEDVY